VLEVVEEVEVEEDVEEKASVGNEKQAFRSLL